MVTETVTTVSFPDYLYPVLVTSHDKNELRDPHLLLTNYQHDIMQLFAKFKKIYEGDSEPP